MKTDLQWVPGGCWLAVKTDVHGEVEARLHVGEEEGGLLVSEAHLNGGAVQDGAAVVPAAVQFLCTHHRGWQGAGGAQGHSMKVEISARDHKEDALTKTKLAPACKEWNKWKMGARTRKMRGSSNTAILVWEDHQEGVLEDLKYTILVDGQSSMACS